MQLLPRHTLLFFALAAVACGSSRSNAATPDAGSPAESGTTDAASRGDSGADATTDAGSDGGPGAAGDAAADAPAGVVIEGEPFSVAGAVAIVQAWPLGCVQGDAGPDETSCTGQTLRVFLVNNGGLTCGYLTTHPTALLGHVPGLLTAEVDFTNVNGSPEPGSYQILTTAQVLEGGLPTGTSAFVQFNVTSATCDTISYANASGMVTLASVTATMATGSYTLTFPGPAMLAGAFAATICDDPGVGSGGGACASP
jgi:hypothetical protein